MTPSPDGGSTPRPDPTLLTTQQLIREIAALREIVETRLNGNREVLETRLNGMDKAIELLQATSDKFPARIDEKIASLAGIHEEKFSSIQRQFLERDVRAEQTSRDSKTAVDAALQAAKEAVGKSELATFKQLDQIVALIGTNAKASDDKIIDTKDRVTRIESMGLGSATTKSDASKNLSMIIAGVALVASVAIGGLGLALSNRGNGAPAVPPPVVIYQPPPSSVTGNAGTVTDSRSTTKGVTP